MAPANDPSDADGAPAASDRAVPPAAGPPLRDPGLGGVQFLTPTAPVGPGIGVRAFTPAGPPGPPPQWAADPTGRHQLRWWGGVAWTDHVADDQVTSVDPLDAG